MTLPAQTPPDAGCPCGLTALDLPWLHGHLGEPSDDNADVHYEVAPRPAREPDGHDVS